MEASTSIINTPKLNGKIFASGTGDAPKLDLESPPPLKPLYQNSNNIIEENSLDLTFIEDSRQTIYSTNINTSFTSTISSSMIISPLKQRLYKGNYNELILWPDSSLFKHENMPACVLTPRYIYAPSEATSKLK